MSIGSGSWTSDRKGSSLVYKVPYSDQGPHTGDHCVTVYPPVYTSSPSVPRIFIRPMVNPSGKTQDLIEVVPDLSPYSEVHPYKGTWVPTERGISPHQGLLSVSFQRLHSRSCSPGRTVTDSFLDPSLNSAIREESKVEQEVRDQRKLQKSWFHLLYFRNYQSNFVPKPLDLNRLHETPEKKRTLLPSKTLL